MSVEPVIAMRGLTKDYGGGRGVFDLDLEVHRGEVFGFLGPNGAGKTTTIRLLLDLIRPTAGHATILGHDVRTEGLAVRRRVGYLPGELSMYKALDGQAVLRRIQGLRDGLDPDHVDGLVRRLDAEMRRPIGELSSGNKRKVGLILALAHDPDVLILDEPTSGLDPLMQREIHAMVRAAARGGKTVFLSSHFLPEVERVCDRVAIVREGRLLDVRPLSELAQDRVNRLVFTFRQAPAPGSFQHLPGVQRVEVRGDQIRVTVDGSVDAVVKEAARSTVLDVDSEDPDLEEVFLAYYEGERKAGEAGGREATAGHADDGDRQAGARDA